MHKILFYVSFILLGIIALLSLFSLNVPAEKLINVLVVLLFVAGISGSFSSFLKKNTLRNYIQNFDRVKYVLSLHHKKIIILTAITYVLLNSFKTIYYLGGDDTRLYYFYPWEYFYNYASETGKDIAISNVSTFLPPRSIALFVLLLAVCKSILPFVNLQGLFYSLNIVLGIAFFYKFITYVLTIHSIKNTTVSFISSFMYVFSIFNFYTLFNSQLMAIYLVSIFPLFLFLFTKSIYEKKPYLLIVIALVFSIFGVVSVGSLWFAATLLTCLPIVLYLLRSKIKQSVGYGVILFFLLIVFNVHWLIYLPETTLGDRATNAVNSVVSQSFLVENANGVRSTSEINSLFYPILNSYHRQIQINFHWPYFSLYQSWYFVLLPLNLFFIVSILISGFLSRTKSKTTTLYLICAVSFLTALYLYTVNIGTFTFGNPGISLYLWMVNTIPGFVVFRNMYDKFGHAMAFNFSVLMAVSTIIILNSIKVNKIKKGFVLCYSILVLLQALPFITNKFNTVPIWTTNNLYQGNTQFSNDYLSLITFIKEQNTAGKYLVLPLSGGNIISIADANLPNHYYVGVSPLLILTGKNDFSGFLSFGPQEPLVKEAVYSRDYESLRTIFRNQNIDYIIDNKDVPSQLAYGYMYSNELYDLQDEEFKIEFFGEKVRDFGKKYSIYTLKDTYGE